MGVGTIDGQSSKTERGSSIGHKNASSEIPSESQSLNEKETILGFQKRYYYDSEAIAMVFKPSVIELKYVKRSCKHPCHCQYTCPILEMHGKWILRC